MRTITRTTIFAAILLVAGCNLLTPKTYQLEQIHATYTSEWAQAQFPDGNASRAAPENGERFKNTLAAIHNYKRAHGSDTRVAAHLTVLEGMIYLQSGKPGMARLLEDDVANAIKLLKPVRGGVARDYVFAVCYEHLVDGWEAVDNLTASEETFFAAADGIREKLEGLKVKDGAAQDVDSGGAYVATCAVIFYRWGDEVDLNTDKRVEIAKKSKAVLGPWLTTAEKTAASSDDWRKSIRNDRIRYVSWYRWAVQNAQ